MSAAPDTVAASSDRNWGISHSPPPSAKIEVPATRFWSMAKVRENDRLAATTVSWPSSSRLGASDDATRASARLLTTTGRIGASFTLAASRG